MNGGDLNAVWIELLQHQLGNFPVCELAGGGYVSIKERVTFHDRGRALSVMSSTLTSATTSSGLRIKIWESDSRETATNDDDSTTMTASNRY
jgi:hypothetical protein